MAKKTNMNRQWDSTKSGQANRKKEKHVVKNKWTFDVLKRNRKWLCQILLRRNNWIWNLSTELKVTEVYKNIFFSFSKTDGIKFIYLFIIILVLPYINMNPPRLYTCSQSWTPLPPSSPYHPSGSSQCIKLKKKKTNCTN